MKLSGTHAEEAFSGVKPELLSPAGDWECLRAAVANGADAVYFGLPCFNARLRADNFKEEELPDVMEYLHRFGVRGFVTLNVLVFTEELAEAERYLRLLSDSGVDAAIVQDLGVAELARRVAPQLDIHASTQMTLTSPEGIEFAKRLGIKRAVLARELSLRELHKFPQTPEGLPLEVFVHGALCVAYSGQCLTSESLGQRSANRGECAQACRMTYELIVDGEKEDLGEQQYLLSPQDLAAIEEIPKLIESGIVSFKIEGRLKSPEYVAAVTQVYRKHIDAACREQNGSASLVSSSDWYKLEMSFSRGLHTGWLKGVDHQSLVHARFGKKRGALVGKVTRLGADFAELDRIRADLKPGDGVVFESLDDTDKEQGGRVFQIDGKRLRFQYGRLDFERIAAGCQVWKTDDPALRKDLRRTFKKDPELPVQTLDFLVSGRAGEPMHCKVTSANYSACFETDVSLQLARKRPLTPEVLREQLGRLGETGFVLGEVVCKLEGNVMLPVSALNRLRRAAVERFASELPNRPQKRTKCADHFSLKDLLPQIRQAEEETVPELIVLCRQIDQVTCALEANVRTIYADFEDIRRYREAVERVRNSGRSSILLATPRIQKAGECGFFSLIESYKPDGVLVRNLGAISFFRKQNGLKLVGDFSLNVANPLTAGLLLKEGLERLTASYDLNSEQMTALLKGLNPGCLEVSIHQHMPMFHMEHCVFAAFLSNGKDHLDCGRPCDRHRLQLRDRVGQLHPVAADVGCRNTVYNGRAQSAASYWQEFHRAGAHHFRLEFLDESPRQMKQTLEAYRSLLDGKLSPEELVQRLRVVKRVGVTAGPLEVK